MEQSLSESGPTWVQVGLQPDWLVGEMASEAVLHLEDGGDVASAHWLIEDCMMPNTEQVNKK